jgi:hypothetical protein
LFAPPLSYSLAHCGFFKKSNKVERCPAPKYSAAPAERAPSSCSPTAPAVQAEPQLLLAATPLKRQKDLKLLQVQIEKGEQERERERELY